MRASRPLVDRAAAGGARPRGADARPAAHASRSSTTLLNTLAYNPPGDTEEGFLFWASWVNHLGPAVFSNQDGHGPDPPRPRRVRLPDRAAARERRARQPAARRARAAARDARTTPASARRPRSADERGRGPADAEGRPQLRPHRRDGRRSRCRASRCCCSCGSRSAARSRSSRRATGSAPRSSEASQLATEADVRISGVPVGKVKTIETDPKTGRSTVTMELEAKYSPLPSDAKALLRQKTLLGETYVELTPGTEQAEKVPEGGRLPEGNVSETVELDEILRTFDPETRAAFQEWMQTQAQAIAGHGRDLNDALGNLGPFAEDAAVLVDILNRQEPAVTRLISNTGVVFEALTERDGPAARADRELQPRLPDDRAARPRAAGGVRRAADVRARVAPDGRPADAVRARHRPAGRPAAAGRARALADAEGPVGAGAGPEGVLPRAQPADRRLEARGFPAAERCCATCARCSPRSTRRCASSTRSSTSSASTSAS